MPDVRSFFEKEFLYHFNLDGRDVALTIKKVVQGAVQGTDGKKQKKPVVYFEGTDKGLALNITNVRTIGGMHGFKAEGWVGKRIVLYPTTTTFGPKTVECIRVRPTVPTKTTVTGKLNDAAQPIEREPGADDNEGAIS